jgi:hypothetical protein
LRRLFGSDSYQHTPPLNCPVEHIMEFSRRQVS